MLSEISIASFVLNNQPVGGAKDGRVWGGEAQFDQSRSYKGQSPLFHNTHSQVPICKPAFRTLSVSSLETRQGLFSNQTVINLMMKSLSQLDIVPLS